MNTKAMMTTATLAASGEPPTEFRIWPYGEIQTTKGKFSLSQANAQAIVESWAAWGNDMHFDYEHAAFDSDMLANGDAPAAGWFKLEARNDGLYATSIEWTEKAFNRIKAKELRYYSPAFLANDSGEIVDILNCALTNNPATHDLDPLAASRVLANRGKGKEAGKPGNVARDNRTVTLANDMSFDTITRELNEAINEATGYNGWVVEVFSEYAIFRRGDDLYKVAYTLGPDGVTLTGDAVEVERTYTETEGGKTMKTLLLTMKLKENATEAEAVAVANRMVATEAQLITLTGAASADAAIGTINAWKASHDRLQEVEQKHAAEAAEADKKERAQLITTGMREGKIPPAQKDFWEGQTTERVKAYLTTAIANPAIVVEPPKGEDGETGTQPSTAAQKAQGELVMTTGTALAVAKAMGNDPKAVAAYQASKTAK